MHAKIQETEDGRTLVAATFRRGPESPEVVAVYYIHWPSDFTLISNPIVVTPLSVTRVDTREPDSLSATELSEVLDAVVSAADKYDSSLQGPE